MTNPNFNRNSWALQNSKNKAKAKEAVIRPVDLIVDGRREAIANSRCLAKPIGCGGVAIQFKDELSRKEYHLSALCQECQNQVFGGDDNE